MLKPVNFGGFFYVLLRRVPAMHLCIMLTTLYTRSTPLNVIVASAAKEIFSLLLQRQSAIAEMDYNHHRAPYLHDVLQPSLAEITPNDDGVQVVINYPMTIRFLDLKKAKSGKKKRYYSPIYNRSLFGHVYGRGYSLSNVINSALYTEYQNYSQNIKNVMESTTL